MTKEISLRVMKGGEVVFEILRDGHFIMGKEGKDTYVDKDLAEYIWNHYNKDSMPTMPEKFESPNEYIALYVDVDPLSVSKEE